MSKTPLGPIPRQVSLNYFDERFKISKDWGSFLNILRENTYDIRDFELTINPSSVGANSTSEQSFDAVEVDTTDVIVSVSKPTETSGIIIGNYRAGDEKLFITFANVTSSSVNPPEETYLVTIIKR